MKRTLGILFFLAILGLAVSGAVIKRYGVPAPVKVHVEVGGALSVSKVQYFFNRAPNCRQAGFTDPGGFVAEYLTREGIDASRSYDAVVQGSDCLLWATTTFASPADWNRHATVLLTSLQTSADWDDYYAWPTPGQIEIQDLGDGTLKIVQQTQIAAWTDAAIKAVGGAGIFGYGGIDFHLSSSCPVQATSPPADEINGPEAIWHLGAEDDLPVSFSITTQASC